jgi:hypothetical protein
MYWLIEDERKIDILTRMQLKEAYVEIIPTSPTKHPVENNVSCVYIKPLDGSKGHMVNVEHFEALHVDIELIYNLLNSIEKIYVIDKKEFLHYFYHQNIISLDLLTTDFSPKHTTTHSFFYNKYQNEDNLNNVIPIVKHYETCECNFNILKSNFNSDINLFYNNRATIVFNSIEKNGLKVDPVLFKQYFNQDIEEYLYTQYKLNTTTRRPSNKFGGINFAALNKDNNERKCFIPNNNFLLEMDISAYHPTLLASRINFNFSSPDIHGEFAQMYGVDYNKAKEITFKQLYGGIWKEYKHLEFFQKVEEFTQYLWDEFETHGFIECPISYHKFEKDKLENMNPQKLLNYYLQNLETSTNVCILWEILKTLRGKNTKLILYVYDSFLFDVDKTEKDTLKEIVDIFSKYKLHIKYKKGYTYNFN